MENDNNEIGEMKSQEKAALLHSRNVNKFYFVIGHMTLFDT